MRLDKISVGLCVVSLFLCFSYSAAFSRSTTLSGSVSMGQEYDSNIFQSDSGREEQWTTNVTPVLTLTSEGEKDVFTVVADSDLEWDQRRDERDFEHGFSINNTREISQYFTITVGNDYTYTDGSPETDMDDAGLSYADKFARANGRQREEVVRLLFPEIGDYTDDDYLRIITEIDERYAFASPSVQQEVDQILSNSTSRRRSWENEISVSAQYEFARDSILEIGYAFTVFDDREDYYDEYDKHNPYLNLSYRFHPQWLISGNYAFTKTDYDEAGKQEVQDAGVNLAYDLTLKDQFSLTYDYQNTDYDEDDRIDYNEQNVGLSWDHNQELGQHLLLTSTLMADYVDRDIDFDERGLSLSLGLTRAIQRGSLSLGGDIGIDERDADDGWDKYHRNWSFSAGLSYQIIENLLGNLSADYEKRYDWNLAGDKSIFDDYGAGAGVTWSFSRWYTLSLNYTYDRLESSEPFVSGYHEHTVMMQLSAAKDLFKW
jgi:hypothetical protein